MTHPIRTEHLSKNFRRTGALADVTLHVPQGAIYALVGPNGAGKTTALKVLMNIHRPTAGTSEVLGVDSRRLSPAEFRQIGYVSENQEMPDWMTVDYYLHYLSNFYPAWDRTLADDLVRQLQLPSDRKLRHLSRGMRMKAALASSLAYRPKLIVLDEPFTGLDPLVRDEFIESLLARAEDTTILISSHDLAEIESFASHVGYLDQGRLLFSEELESLTARFREIVLTFDAAPALPIPWPTDWLKPEISTAVVRFIDTAFDPAATPARIASIFAAPRDFAVNPMPLRSIFVALAKSGRTAHA
jgi:ABC-2 type transport system ATP-binding protein